MPIYECKTEIEEIINLVVLNREDYNDNLSLSSGKCGVSLFLFNAAQCFNRTDILNISGELFLDCIYTEEQDHSPTLYGGTTGTYWLLQYYINNKFIESSNDNLDLLNNYDAHLINICEGWAIARNYDLLYGIIGAGIYYLERSKKFDVKKYLDKTIELLLSFSDMKSINERFWYKVDKENVEIKNINLGYAHGITSILSYFSIVSKQTGNAQYFSYATEIFNFFKSLYPFAQKDCIFPHQIIQNIPSGIPSRLGWCYGDLSIGYSFLLAGYNASNNEMISTGNEIIEKSILRKYNVDYTGIRDNGLCHGTSGLIFILDKIYRMTNSINVLRYKNELLDVYKNVKIITEGNKILSYNNEKRVGVLVSGYGFLEGLSGIGLSLLSHAFPTLSPQRTLDWGSLLLI